MDPSQTHGNSQTTLLVQWNAFGFRSKLAELQLLVNRYDPFIFAIQEILVPSGDIPDFVLGGRYTWVSALDTSHPGKNGAALGIRKDVPFKKIGVQSRYFQIAACQIEIPYKVTIASIYMSPMYSSIGYERLMMEELRSIVRTLPSPFILTGDFNAHNTVWGSYKDSPRGDIMLQIVTDENWYILNDGAPTNIHRSSGRLSAIDLTIASQIPTRSYEWRVLEDSFGSDHFPIVVELTGNDATPNGRPRWITSKADWPKYAAYIDEQININRTYNHRELTEIINEAAAASMPKTSGKRNPRSVPWWSSEVHQAIKARRKALRALRRSQFNDPGYPALLTAFKAARAVATRKIKLAKRESWIRFQESIGPDTNSATLWAKVRACSQKAGAEKVVL